MNARHFYHFWLSFILYLFINWKNTIQLCCDVEPKLDSIVYMCNNILFSLFLALSSIIRIQIRIIYNLFYVRVHGQKHDRCLYWTQTFFFRFIQIIMVWLFGICSSADSLIFVRFTVDCLILDISYFFDRPNILWYRSYCSPPWKRWNWKKEQTKWRIFYTWQLFIDDEWWSLNILFQSARRRSERKTTPEDR